METFKKVLIVGAGVVLGLGIWSAAQMAWVKMAAAEAADKAGKKDEEKKD